MFSGAGKTVDIGAYIQRFEGRFTDFKRAVLLKLFGSVIKDTPVLTGRLRANWQFGKATAPDSIVDSVADPTTQIEGQVNSQVDGKDGSVFLANSLPYVNRIEYEGHSSVKAPEGMVRKNLVRISNILSEEVSKG